VRDPFQAKWFALLEATQAWQSVTWPDYIEADHSKMNSDFRGAPPLWATCQ